MTKDTTTAVQEPQVARSPTPAPARRLTSGLPAQLQGLRRGIAGWQLARWTALIPQIHERARELAEKTDEELRKESLSLRYRAKSGEALKKMIPDAFALVQEAASRALQMRHFDVQLLGGIALFHGAIAEMETGEGKTLTATLPLYLRALPGKGAHLATVNDYLARRDAEWMRPVYQLLGLSVGVIETEMSRPQRRQEYASDITYGTAKEFGFDFLRDRLVLRQIQQQRMNFFDSLEGRQSAGDSPIQRDPYFALVDEADSVLIDEARTPLIISALPGDGVEEVLATYRWAASVVQQFHEDDHYEYDHEKKKVELTVEGRQRVRALPKPRDLDGVGLVDCYDFVERAIKVHRDFLRNQHYVVSDKGEVIIVDEYTGRLAEGRKWRDGIHQAIEAAEGVEISVDSGQAARITVQDLFLRYEHLAGMTGTAASSASEFRKIYKKLVCQIPTNRMVRRQRLNDCIFDTADAKWDAIAAEVVALHAQGRPVLIGTRTIENSETLSRRLSAQGIEHQVLNAHHVAAEAEIVALAGQPGKVTVATNMAGRGTDIKLGAGVEALGGLHVICSEIHDSARIDRQLLGRCGRQGDPGTTRQYMSLEDEILRTGFGPKRAARLCQRIRHTRRDQHGLGHLFRRAQRKVERRHLRDRQVLLHHEKQRKKMHRELGQDPYLDTTS
jgi:preprotein translocase subunit SecA